MWWIGAWLAAAATDAHARALAVLELQKGAGSVEHEGLGKGLTGMIVADLVGLPNIEIVERERIDALQSELALGEAGFLDPATAVRAGRAIGAEVWLVGSYSVVGDTIQMDARLIDAGTQKVLEGASASGPLTDWVGVEKALVEGVAADLGIAFDPRARREFYSRVPTENFDAFASYSLGLSEKEKGDFVKAEAAFRDAVARDPEFSEALNSINALRDLVERARAADAAKAAGARTELVTKVLANTHDPRAHSGPWTDAQLATLPARWAVLLERGDACQRLAEMEVVLAAFDWQPQKAVQQHFSHVTDFRTKVDRAATAAGFVPWDKNRPHPDRAVEKGLGVKLFESTANFLFDDLKVLNSSRDAGMAASLLACRGGKEAAAALDGWHRALLSRQLLDVPATDVLTNGQALVFLRGWFEAESGTVSAETRRTLDAMVAAAPDDKRRALISLVDALTFHAVREERWRLAALGMSVPTIRTRIEAIAAGTPPFRTSPAWCSAEADQSWRSRAAELVAMWDQDIAEAERPELGVAFSAVVVRSVGDVGCFDGVPTRFSTWVDTKAFIREAAARTHPNAATDTSCAPRISALLATLAFPDGQPAAMQVRYSYQAISNYYALVQARCLVEAR